MNLSVNYKSGAESIYEIIRKDFEHKLDEICSVLPKEAIGCCCVVQKERGLMIHLVIRAGGSCFETSIVGKSLPKLAKAFSDHLTPQLDSWVKLRKAGKQVDRSISLKDPVKKEICRKNLCPAISEHGFWLGGVG